MSKYVLLAMINEVKGKRSDGLIMWIIGGFMFDEPLATDGKGSLRKFFFRPVYV